MKASVEIAKSTTSYGIEMIIAAPHYVEEDSDLRDKIIEKAVDLNARLTAENLPLTVVLGREVRISAEMIPALVRENTTTLNPVSNYLLVELPEGRLPERTGDNYSSH